MLRRGASANWRISGARLPLARGCLNILYGARLGLFPPIFLLARRARAAGSPPAMAAQSSGRFHRWPLLATSSGQSPSFNCIEFLSIFGQFLFIFDQFCWILTNFNWNFVHFRPVNDYLWPILLNLDQFYCTLVDFWPIFLNFDQF